MRVDRPWPLARDELSEIAALLRDEYGLDPGIELAPMAKGHSNLNVAVRLPDGRAFVFRRAPPERTQSFVHEIAVMNWLSRSASWRKTPRPIARLGGELHGRRGCRCFALMELISGSSAKPSGREIDPRPNDLEQIGAMVADLHATFREWPNDAALPNDYAREIPRSIATLEADLENPSPDPADRIFARHASQLTDLARQCRDSWARASSAAGAVIIHGDIRFANILFDASDVAAVLDYEAVGRAPAALEHAIAIRNLLTTETSASDSGQIWAHGANAYLAAHERSRGAARSAGLREQVESLFPIAVLQELHFLLHAGRSSIAPDRRAHLLRVTVSQVLHYSTRGWRIFDDRLR
jgi:Ser/Thr protein kinase RdoA (MazF antagonist)